MEYFYGLLDEGDSILVDGKKTYTVMAKDEESVVLEDFSSGRQFLRLSKDDLETFLWKIDELSILTVEFTPEKEARIIREEAEQNKA